MDNIFGTDGIRNKAGSFPLTPEILPLLGKAIGLWAYNKYEHNTHILIAHDTRQSCTWIKESLIEGLLSVPVTLYDTKILPTPTVAQLLTNNAIYSSGIIISASHNPYYDNGIKLIDKSGSKLSPDDELYITNLFYKLCENKQQEYKTIGIINTVNFAQEIYISNMLNIFSSLCLKDITIVLDLANGATYEIAPLIYQALGAKIILINNNPTGTNINLNCGALHLESLQQAVIAHKADFGFAFDGDGDRVIAVNSDGEIKNGDDILAILSNHPDYINYDTIVTTVMSNYGLETFFEKNNKKIIRVAVGDKYVLKALVEHGLYLGGEQAGHIILRNHLKTGDGILVSLKILETLMHTKNYRFETFIKFPQVLLTVNINSKKDLALSPLKEIIKEAEDKISQGRLLVRYSGTETALRIMVEDKSKINATTIAFELSKALQEHLV